MNRSVLSGGLLLLALGASACSASTEDTDESSGAVTTGSSQPSKSFQRVLTSAKNEIDAGMLLTRLQLTNVDATKGTLDFVFTVDSFGPIAAPTEIRGKAVPYEAAAERANYSDERSGCRIRITVAKAGATVETDTRRECGLPVAREGSNAFALSAMVDESTVTDRRGWYVNRPAGIALEIHERPSDDRVRNSFSIGTLYDRNGAYYGNAESQVVEVGKVMLEYAPNDDFQAVSRNNDDERTESCWSGIQYRRTSIDLEPDLFAPCARRFGALPLQYARWPLEAWRSP